MFSIPFPLQDGPPASIQTSTSSIQVYSCQMQRDLRPGFSNFEVQLNSRSKPCEANIYLDVTDCKCCFAVVEICCKWFPVWGFTPVENIHVAFICTLLFFFTADTKPVAGTEARCMLVQNMCVSCEN